MRSKRGESGKRYLWYAIYEDTKRQIRQNKVLFSVYLILRVIVISFMIAQIYNRNWMDVFYCALTLVLFMIPSFIEKKIKIDVPDTMEVIILLFIFAAEILGELRSYYLTVPFWDTALHTVNGFLCAAIGFSLVDILNRSKRFAISLSPFFVLLVAFCFSMTIGVVWEFFEFGMDMIFRTDMQKDTVLTSISSVLFHPKGKNIPVILGIESIEVNGVAWDYGGYIDIGLIDTMADLLVNFVGALVFSVFGWFYLTGNKKGKIAEKFLLTFKDEIPETYGGKGDEDGSPDKTGEEPEKEKSIVS